MYAITRLTTFAIAMLILASCANKKDCYTCEAKTTAKVNRNFYTVGSKKEDKCNANSMDIYLWETGKTKVWVSNDTEYITRAKCIK